MKNQWRLVSALVIVLVIVVFAILNVDPVEVNFGFAKVQWPLILVIVITLILGVAIAVLMATFNSVKTSNAHKEAIAAAQAKIEKLTAENKSLTLRLNNKGKQTRGKAIEQPQPTSK
ncbi:lipopolysaccharide assembly LapA domain-containing protein [Lactiplantibacillus daoliensis]|uniref:Lipopolysaccharide assembly LapA domain-containing protein n=1 Tax=Lactiplantibacillus daoliensis TaxID=2559916 RepID=A0ABW1UJR0_9LACO|nr:LapA family protein [Lactiplantibacillus daoliensis]